MRKNKKAFLALLLVPILLAGFFLWSGAVWNEAEAVHVNPDEIENSTLVIGSHLVHLTALTDSIYEMAQTTADESGQTQIYYKSELADGTWFDITTASSLSDITTAGTPVEKRVIADLFFTHHTKSDGITYDLRTKLPVSIYDIVDPYDLEALPELFPLKTQYETIRETQSDSKAGKAKMKRIEKILTMVVVNDDTIQCDNALTALQKYYNVLKNNNGGAGELSVVQGVMDAVDASRRYYVFRTIEAALSEYAEELTYIKDGEDADGNAVEGSSPDTSLQSAVNDSLENVKNSLITHEGNMLADAEPVMGNTYYTLANQLITDAEAPNHAACDVDVGRLLALQNIQNGIVAIKETELGLLDDSLLDLATTRYETLLKSGVNSDYLDAKAQNVAKVLLDGITNTNNADLNTRRNELEFLITARCERVSNAEGLAYIDQRLEFSSGWYATIPEDGFKSGAIVTLDAHIEFLSSLRRKLELAGGGNEMDALIAQKSDLQTDLLSALDENDLAGAKNIENQIAALDEKIGKLEAESATKLAMLGMELNDLQTQLDAAQAMGDNTQIANLEAELAQVKGEMSAISSSMSDGSLGALISQQKKDALSVVNTANPTNDQLALLQNAVNSLGDMLALDSKIGFPALKEIYSAMVAKRELNNTKAFDPIIAAVEEDILANADAFAAALRNEKTVADLKKVASDFFSGAGTSLLNPGGTGSGSGTGSDSGTGSGSGTGGDSGTGSGSGTGGDSGTGSGSGTGSDSGTGSGSGTGSDSGTGSGSGTGSDSGTGSGSGTGSDSGTGSGSGTGSDSGTGSGSGTGSDSGTGSGSGTGSDSGAGSGSGTGSDSGAGSGSGTSGAGGSNGLAAGAGSGAAGITTTLDSLGDQGEAAVNLVALQLYLDETASPAAETLLNSLARQQMALGNPLVFLRCNDGGNEYLPLETLRTYTGMRYIWNRNKNLGTLAKGATYYGFTAFSDRVLKGKTEKDVDYMNMAVKYQAGLHIPEAYTLQEFGAEAYYLGNSNYGVLVSEELGKKAEDLFALFLS